MYVDSTCEHRGSSRSVQRYAPVPLFRRCSAVAGVFLLVTCAFGQTTLPEPTSRIESFSILQADKAKVAQPPTPDKAEALVRRLEELLILDPSGFFPYFDSVYQGGGLTG